MPTDQRLIEDYIPIEAISAESRREKSIRKGHISTLHLWWARRPLVACRAAVYGALVPAPTDKAGKKKAAEFVADLCKYPGSPSVIAEARRHILEAHAARLTAERVGAGLAPAQATVTPEDIEAGRAPRPRVLDMFAGGGAIPLEALRLGCEAYALDLNPVAHLIELCTLVYPQQYGAPDPAAHGCAADGTWAGLAAEVEHWGKWVLNQVKAEIGDLYPPIPDPAAQAVSLRHDEGQFGMDWAAPKSAGEHGKGMLTPVAYLWTRTVRCKNPACGGVVPLARQTWLAKKEGRYVALKADAETNREKTGDEKSVRYLVAEATSEAGLGFDPAAGNRGGNVACPFCGTVADARYIKVEGAAQRIALQPMVAICKGHGAQDKRYLPADTVPGRSFPIDGLIEVRLEDLAQQRPQGEAQSVSRQILPYELVEANPRSMDIQNYGVLRWIDLFTPRQKLLLAQTVRCVRRTHDAMLKSGVGEQHSKAVVTYLGLLVDKMAQRNNTLCGWDLTSSGGRLSGAFARQSVPMTWDFSEANPFGGASGDFSWALDTLVAAVQSCATLQIPAQALRGSATETPYPGCAFDAIITDPPYYDNVSYSNLSDFFYVWLKLAIGHLYPEHFSSELTPKRKEVVSAFYRHGGNREAASAFYESLLAQSLSEAHRLLKPECPLILVYAHKTTAGWATLVDALQRSGFFIAEAWPLSTELEGGLRLAKAMLASSIFLVARRRQADRIGQYESNVVPELLRVVRERVDRLWSQGVTGADLVIACVGAGLSAFTKYARVEYANGEPVPADTFLAEVEGAVLEALLEKLFGVSQTGISQVDAPTRFYVLWRYAYRQAAIDAGEAILFAYPQHVELDGAQGLTHGGSPQAEKAGGKYRLRDFTERGEDEKLGLPKDGRPAPLIDVLHRVLWLVEHRPALIPAYLDEAQPDLERLRVVAQTLGGQSLAGNGSGGQSLVAARGAEAAALRKLTTNWRSLVETERRGMG